MVPVLTLFRDPGFHTTSNDALLKRLVLSFTCICIFYDTKIVDNIIAVLFVSFLVKAYIA